MKGYLIFLLLFTSCRSQNTPASKAQKLNDYTLTQYNNQLPTESKAKNLQQCDDNLAADIAKLVQEGEPIVQKKAKGKNVFVIFGYIPDQNTLLGNFLADIDLETKPKEKIDTYPRYVGEDKNGNVIYQAATLNGASIASQAVGAYFINEIVKEAKGVKLFFPYTSAWLPATFEYFRDISNMNPETGIFQLSKGESFVLTNLQSYSGFKPFGKHPGGIMDKASLKDSAKKEMNKKEFTKYVLDTSEFIMPPIHFPIPKDYKECLKTKVDEKIIQDLGNSTADLLKHLKDVKANKTMKDSDKTNIIGRALENVTDILSLVSPNMTVDAVSKPLSEYLIKMGKKADAEKIKAIPNYAKVLITVQPDYETKAWAQGLEALENYLSDSQTEEEFKSNIEAEGFDCTNQVHRVISRMVKYELAFEKAIRPNNTQDSIKEILYNVNSIIEGDAVELYNEKVEDQEEANLVLDGIYEKLLTYNETNCKKNLTAAQGSDSCDSAKTKALVSFVEQGSSILEKRTRDQVVTIVGTKTSEKTSVAYALAGQKFDDDEASESEVYPKLIIDPLDAPNSIYTAPSYSKDKKDAEKAAADYFTHSIVSEALTSKVVVAIEENIIKDQDSLKMVLENVGKLCTDVSYVIQSLAFIITNVDIADSGEIDEKVKTVSSELFKAIDAQVKGGKLSTEATGVFKDYVTYQNVTAKNIGVLTSQKNLEDDKTFKAFSDHIKEVVNGKVQFSLYGDKNFPGMLNADSKRLVMCATKKIEMNLKEKVASITEQLKDVYKGWEEEYGVHYTDIFKKFDETVHNVPNILENVMRSESIPGVFDPLANYMVDLHIDVKTESTLLLQSYSRFLQNTEHSYADVLFNGFANLKIYVEDSRRWYYFLRKFEAELLKFHVLKKKNIYRSAAQDLLAMIRTDIAEGSDVVDFIKKVEGLPKDALIKLMGSKAPNLNKLYYLGLIIENIFTTQTDIYCEDGIRFCRGTYVMLSTCLETKCPDSKQTEIQASHAVYIDQDVMAPGEVHTIISPEWQIIGNRSINLNGEDMIAREPKAKNGITTGAPGAVGKPGKPGKQGGSFLGVGEKYIYENGAVMTVSCDGGSGGPGQEGGDGGVGKDPPTPSLPWDTYNEKDYKKDGFEQSYEYSYHRVYNYYLKNKGEHGGKGGDGGKGGIGGLPGTIHIVSITGKDPGVVQGSTVGKTGEAGEGGRAGPTLKADWKLTEEKVYWVFYAPTYRYRLVDHTFTKIYSEEGKGKSGEASANIKKPEPAAIQPDFPRTLNRYKHFFRDIIRQKSRSILHQNFDRKIVDNSKLMQLYDTPGIADDFQKLEEQAYKLKKKTSLVPYYEMLLDEIHDFMGNKTVPEEEKKVLAYIYTAALSKLVGERSKETFLVINLPGYLQIMKEDIKALRTLEADKVVQSYKKDYVNNVEAKIKEAQNLIDNEIIPIVNKHQDSITEKIKVLVADIANRKKENRVQKEKLIKQQRELQSTCLMRKIMAGVNCVVSLTSFLGPTAAAIGGALSAGARILDATLLSSSSEDATAKLAGIPSAVNGQLVTVLALMESKKSAFTDQLSDISGRLDKTAKSDKSVEPIKKKVKYTKDEVAKIDTKKLDAGSVEKMNNLRTDLSKTMQESKSSVATSLANDAKIDKRIENIGRLQTILAMGDQMARDYQAIKGDDDQLEQVGQALKETDANLKKLEAYEVSIYTDMMPMVSNIVDKVSSASDDSKGKSHAALDVSQWKMSEYLSDMKATLTKMTEGFAVSGEFQVVLNKVDSGLQVMNKVYQRIQDQQDKSDLAVFLADINGKKSLAVDVKDPLLSQMLADIQVAIQRNIILQKFDYCHKSFLQSLFPFGTELLQEFSLPPQMSNTNSTDRLITYATQRVTQMINKIQTTETTISSYDNDINNGAFFIGDEEGSEPAFYTWTYDKNRETIDNLFQGKTIELTADITRQHEDIVDRIGIKFNILRLAFSPQNRNLKEKLYTALNGCQIDLKPISDFQYKCNNKFYTMGGSSFTIRYSHKLDGSSEVVARSGNDVYNKIRSNTAMFSPFTKWNITLLGTKSVMKKVAKYSGKPIDVKLVGLGFYVNEESDICNDNLDLIYHRDKSLKSVLPEPEPEDEDEDDDF